MVIESAARATFGPSLNAAQRAGATYGIDPVPGQVAGGGPLLVIAGAGTGKTNTLAHRVAYLLLNRVAPERIALMTFSRRAAQEMLQRAERITGEALLLSKSANSQRTGVIGASIRQLWSGTFHALGNRILREYAHALSMDANFSILDRGDSADLIDLVRQDLGLARKAKRFPRKDTCLSIYSLRVNTGKTLEETLEREFPWCAEWHDELTALFRGYVAAKQKQQLLDYDDLLLYWHALMQEPKLAKDVGGRFDHVLVDEYQDTNTLQADILRALKPNGEGLCVVGDDAQSIYSFRAASVENILGFPEQFTPPAKVITLDQNYRSVQPILDAANALMHEATRKFDKDLRSAMPSGQKPWHVMVEDDRAQALYVVEQILAHREEGTPLREQAVLMRKSHDSDVLELELTRRDIPYVKYGGLKFLEAAHVKDLLALLRFVDNPRNRLAGFRTLQLLPGVGPTTAERCLQAIEEHDNTLSALQQIAPPAQAREDWPAFVALIDLLSAASQWGGQMTEVRRWYEPHLERLHGAAEVRAGDLEQLEALSMQHATRESFLADLTLDPPQATSDETDEAHKDEDYLILSTVHSAKGQEWDSVFTLNVVDGTFPNEFSTESPEQIEEERRLLYVAMTRAKRNLHLVAPLKFYVTQQRRYGERHLYGGRSRFLTDPVLEQFEQRAWPANSERVAAAQRKQTVRVDVAAQIRSMWDD